MIFEILILGMLTGWILKGRYQRLLDVKLKLLWLVGVSLGLMVITRVLHYTDIIPFASPVHAIARVTELLLICVFAGANIRIPGAKLFLAGLIINAFVVTINGGQMPVAYDRLVEVWGKQQVEQAMVTFPSTREMLIDEGTRLAWLCDVIPARRPFVFFRGVCSIGDLISSLGAMIAIIAIMRTPLPSEQKTALEEQ